MNISLSSRSTLASLCAALVCSVTALSAAAALKEGDKAPSFQLQASQAGKEFTYSLQEALKKGPVVVYFYPAAFTGGCNIQAHSFAESADKFAAAGASIVGVSLDKIGQLNEFSADLLYCAGKIPVASDAEGRTARAYNLDVKETPSGRKNTRGQEIDHDRTERTTFIVTPDGKVASAIGGVEPDANVQKALEAVQKLAAKKS